MKDKESVKRTFDLRTLAERDTQILPRGSYLVGPCPFCGGRDRFNLRLTDTGWRWFCRKCANKMWNDSIAYVMRRENIDFLTALKRMGSDQDSSPPAFKSSPFFKIELPHPGWQSQTRLLVEQACSALHSSEGKHVRSELLRRGIQPSAWFSHLLGAGRFCNQPAVLIPHFDSQACFTAVKYRLIGDSASGRYRALKGSKVIFWGLHTLRENHTILVLVEGELNAISIAQSCPGVSVLSFGGENLNATQRILLGYLSSRYQKVIVWTDKGEKAQAVQSAAGRPCRLIQSPHGLDANNLLQSGQLGDFLVAFGGPGMG